jgi:PKD repeat protein
MPFIKTWEKPKNEFHFCYPNNIHYNSMTSRLFTLILISLLCWPLTSLAAVNSQHDLQITFSSIPTLNCTTAGFRIYDDSATKIYETTDADTNEITCPDVEVTGTEATFTMTSFCEDGRESAHSAPFTVTFPDESPLNAVITANLSSGTAPLDVAFNGSDSTGPIVNYHWNFGDGSASVDGINVTHRFLTPADYTVTLTVSDGAGDTSTSQYTITASGGSPDNTPPVAVISATTAVGDSPLSVTFDGSESSDADGDPLTYYWNFGDGSSSDGSASSATHIYTVAGTYQATLTVFDGTNQTISNPIPILVSDGGPGTGKPTASISFNRQAGIVPLTVNFNGSASTPSSGADSIVQYEWSFGDGDNASGKIVSHTFEVIGEYSVTLTVTDNSGKSNEATVKINGLEKNDMIKLLPLIYKLLLLNNTNQHTEKP